MPRHRWRTRAAARPLPRASEGFGAFPSASCSMTRALQRPPSPPTGSFVELGCRDNAREAITYRIGGTVARYRRSIARRCWLALRQQLLVEPQVLEARAVVDAVDHQGQTLDLRLPAGRLTGIEDDRANIVLGQPFFDLPHHFLAFLPVRLHRLPIYQLVELRIAIAGVVTVRAAHVILVELLIGVVEAILADHHANAEVLAHDLGIPLRGVDGFELAVDVDLLQLVD